MSEAFQETLTHRFESFKHDFFINIEWIDPRNWLEDCNYGIPMIKLLSGQFKCPLTNKGFDATKALTELKRFRIFVKATYSLKLESGSITPKEVWTKIFTLCKQGFPNVCLLGKTMLSISGSNSNAEQAFSILNSILNDHRMKLKHLTNEMLIRIKGSNLNWSDVECDDIIHNAVDIYMEVCCKTKQDEPAPTKKKQEEVIEDRVEEILTSILKTFILNPQTKNKGNERKKKNFKLNS